MLKGMIYWWQKLRFEVYMLGNIESNRVAWPLKLNMTFYFTIIIIKTTRFSGTLSVMLHIPGQSLKQIEQGLLSRGKR